MKFHGLEEGCSAHSAVHANRSARRGSVLLMALVLLTALSVLTIATLFSGTSGAKVVNQQDDDYRLLSSAESTGNLAVENLWSAYLRTNGGGAGDISSFRTFLAGEGIAAGANGGFGNAVDWLPRIELTQSHGIDHARINALTLQRRDHGYSTELHFNVSNSTRRGENVARGGTQRTLEMVYSVQPAPFEGFDYAILTRNVNCIFCHTKIDSARRAFNTDPTLYDSFARVKVGTLESMEIRNDNKSGISDQDADTLLAGTLYIRGEAYTGWAQGPTGVPISDWTLQSMRSAQFDSQGQIQADNLGNLVPNFFAPGSLSDPMENLYLDYPLDTQSMVDGVLPQDFPPPFADDGGIDPVTGAETTSGANNKKVDANEFYAATLSAQGTLSGGVINVSNTGAGITTNAAWTSATTVGNTASLGAVTHGNVILTGTAGQSDRGQRHRRRRRGRRAPGRRQGHRRDPRQGQHVHAQERHLRRRPDLHAERRARQSHRTAHLRHRAGRHGQQAGLRLGREPAHRRLPRAQRQQQRATPRSSTAPAAARSTSRWPRWPTSTARSGRSRSRSCPARARIRAIPPPGPSSTRSTREPTTSRASTSSVPATRSRSTTRAADCTSIPTTATWKGPETPFSWNMSMISVYNPADTTNPLFYDQTDGRAARRDPAAHGQRRLAGRPDLRERHEFLGKRARTGHALPGGRADVHQQRHPGQHRARHQVRGLDDGQRRDDLRRPGPAHARQAEQLARRARPPTCPAPPTRSACG